MLKKVLFYGFGPSHITYKKIIDSCEWIDEKFCISQTSSFAIQEKLIFGKENHLSLEEIFYHNTDNLSVDPSIIDSDKRRFNKKSGSFKDIYYENIYKIILNAIEKFDPNLIVFSKHAESPDGLILSEIARQKNILCAMPHQLRFLGGSIFSHSPYEGDIIYNEKFEKLKFEIIKGEHFQLYKGVSPQNKNKKSLMGRISRFLELLRNRPKSFTLELIKWKFEDFIKYREFKKQLNIIFYRRISIKPEYSKNYIYYPLHVSPEASINIPGPYYKDQLRAVDEIRYNLPKNTLLYIKEHPIGFYRQKNSFYNELLKKSRVRLIDHNVSSKELILNAKCVVSVTGTACLEAFIWGIPSVTLSKSFFSTFLINEIIDIKNDTLNKPSIDEINKALSMIKNNSFDFVSSTPDYYDLTLTKNFRNYINGLETFLKTRGYLTI
ncbi:MAG: hypothetical protein CMD29_02235 [Flavobacteriales bacterium]|nr:hypothetical protein [Flavobacteriales bacterium]